jgi:hypothetical protein
VGGKSPELWMVDRGAWCVPAVAQKLWRVGKYIWFNGALGWGIGTGIICAVVMAAILAWKPLPMFLLVALTGFPSGGHFVGHLTWKSLERDFERVSREEPD